MTNELCIYQPGKHNIIDVLLHDGGTGENQAALENARQRYPGAEIMPFDDWRAEKAKQQDEPVTWTEIDDERYWEMLECVPPAAMNGRAFLVGEPYDHHAVSGRPRFTACIMYGTSHIVERPEGGVVCTLHQEAAPGSRFFQSDRPVTVTEFKTGLPRPTF